MMSVSESGPRRPAAVVFGLATALACAVLCLPAAFWNPPGGLPPAVIFFGVAYGIHRRSAWSAYGGALLLLAAAVKSLSMASLAPADVAIAVVVLGAGAVALFRAGRKMPVVAAPVSRAAWIALAGFTFVLPMVCRAYVIASGSMSPTIMQGDQLLVLPLRGAPVRAELVQFRYPVDRKQMFVKRVVAVGGDRVHLRAKQLFVNGAAVNEPYATHVTDFDDEFRDNFPVGPNVKLFGNWEEELRAHTVNGEVVVPEGKYFVLGDNRDNSLDSRYFGFLDRSDIVGRPALIYFSSDAPKATPVLLHPATIRWARMFKGL